MVHSSPLVRSLVLGLTAFRAACLAWLVAVLLATRDDIANVAAGVVLVGAATVVTALWAYRLRVEGARPHRQLGAPATPDGGWGRG